MSGNRAVLVGAVLLVAMAANVKGVCKQLNCPQANGYFAHPRSCVAYVKCVEGKAFLEKCPANLHYNPGTGMCDLPENTKCVEEEKLRSTSCKLSPPPKLRTAPVPGIKCDCGKCCRKANPLDCSSFYECDENGNAFSKPCSPSLVYNPVKEDCDLATNYKCPAIPSCSCKCRYPVDGECEAFYRCDELGKPADKEYCDKSLFFNPDTETCDHRDNVDCHAGPAPTVVPGECKDLKSDCKYWVANGDCICDEFKSGDCSWQHYVQKSCPNTCKLKGCSGSPNPPVTKPVVPGECKDLKSDCKYWVANGDCICDEFKSGDCSWQHYVQSNCPNTCKLKGCSGSPNPPVTKPTEPVVPGECKDLKSDCKWWAANGDCICDEFKSGDCSWQHSVQKNCPNTCKLKGCSGSPKPPVIKPPPPPTPAPPTIDGCVINCQLGQYYRHPSDCTKFIQCAPYGPQEMPCGAGTRWDQDILTCNHASQTKCVTGQYKDSKGKKCGGEPEQPVGPDCDLQCPQANGEFAHPRDCKKWVHCSNNIPHIKDCPANLFFDSINRVCNWPHETVCVATLESGCEIPILPTPTSPTNPIGPPEVCDCECCLRPHPEDCESYYYCDGTNSEFHTCSKGLVFHPQNETCVFAADYPQCNIIVPPKCLCDCLYPSPVCSEFFKCVDDKPERKECPNRLFFNPAKHACDYPSNVECATPPSKRSGFGRIAPAIGADDCANLPDGRYANRENSDDFYHCARGIAFLLKCQEGSAFSQRTGRCERN